VSATRHWPRRLVLVASCLSSAAVLSLTPLATTESVAGATTCSSSVRPIQHWMISILELQSVQQLAPTVSQADFARSSSFVIESPGVHEGTGTVVARFRSYRVFQRAIARDSINPATHWVLYDNEAWRYTPKVEQRQPVRYERLFAQLAHEHGYKVILAPAQSLVPGFTHQANAWRKYLSLGLATVSGRYANVYDIQAQPYETAKYRSSGAYRSFVLAAARQARAANHSVIILAGVSSDRVQNASELVNDIDAVRSTVGGYWLNIPGMPKGQRLQVAAQALTQTTTSSGTSASPNCLQVKQTTTT
jgi:hypothetical protein